MTQAPPSSTSQHSTTPSHGQSLADRLSAGEEFAVTFGGQGTDWFGTLRDLVEEDQRTDRIGALVEESARLVEPVSQQLAAALPRPFEPHRWLEDGTVPASGDLQNGSLSLPGVLLTQLATLDQLRDEGLDLAAIGPVAAVGHSQGILGVAAFAGRRDSAGESGHRSDVELMAIARLIGAAGTIAGRRAGLVPHGQQHDQTPMLAVTGATPAELEDLLVAATSGQDAPAIAAVNGPRRVVVSGSPAALRRFRAALEQARGRRRRRARGQDPRRSRLPPRSSSRSRSPSASTTRPSRRPSTWSATGPRPAAWTPVWPRTSPTPSASTPSTGRAS